jgi:hypothetical protein
VEERKGPLNGLRCSHRANGSRTGQRPSFVQALDEWSGGVGVDVDHNLNCSRRSLVILGRLPNSILRAGAPHGLGAHSTPLSSTAVLSTLVRSTSCSNAQAVSSTALATAAAMVVWIVGVSRLHFIDQTVLRTKAFEFLQPCGCLLLQWQTPPSTSPRTRMPISQLMCAA